MIWLPFDFLYSKLRGHPGMGLGDAKLTALAGAWFGWPGAVFALFAGAVQATAVTLALLAVRGKIEEPEAVVRERREVQAALAGASPEGRLELERAIAEDPLLTPPEAGLGRLRVPFGPFLALAVLEYLLLGSFVVESFVPWVAGLS
jgi:leader peptidase (prepilin peptidase)/N-methyltransferase